MSRHNNNYCKAFKIYIADSKKKGPGIRKICPFLILLLIAGMITGCKPEQNNQPAMSNKPTEVKKQAVSSNGPKDVKQQAYKPEIDWQGLAADYNPPRIDGLLGAIGDSVIAADGSLTITPDIKREFNKMGNDYRFFFLPVVDWYNFEGTGEAISYMLYTWTGEFGTFPKSAPQYEAEARLRKLFAAKNHEYPQLEHKTYTKLVNYDGKGYTLWIGSYNDHTMVYDLTAMKVRQEGTYTYYTATADEYQFDSTGSYEPGENEKLMFAKAQDWSLDYPATLARLLETGEISEAANRQTYTIQFRVEGDNTTPMIVSVNQVFY